MSQNDTSIKTIGSDKDVIIVGTGIAGSLIAKLLTDHVFDTKLGKMIHRSEARTGDGDRGTVKELSVLMLEAGLEAGLELDSANSMSTYNEYIRTFYMQEAKVPNSPYPNLKQAPSPNVLDIQQIHEPFPGKKGYLVQKGPMPFASDAIRVGGGTTMHWLGTTPRMLPNDFHLKSKYDKGKNWPIDYTTLKPYYEMAEYEIGVSGNVSEQVYPEVKDMKEYYGKSYVFPMDKIPQSYMDQLIIKGLDGSSVTLEKVNYPLKMVPSPQGRNSTPNSKYDKSGVIRAKVLDSEKAKEQEKDPGYKLEFAHSGKTDYKALGAVWNPYMGERCEGNASCVPICPVQAKYNALKTLKKALYKVNENKNLQRHEYLEVKAQSVVYRLSVEPGESEERKISKVHLRRYISQDKTNFVEEVIDTSDKIVILAANAFENPKILLNSKYTFRENNKIVERTVANRSDQVGRNLMDHMVMLTWGLFPEPVYPYRGPGSTTNISSFRDGDFRGTFAPWISPLDNWGWSWPAFSPGTDIESFLGEGLFGKKLREKLADRLSRQVLFHFEIEQLPNENNRVTINNEYLDVLGIPRPVIEYGLTEYEKKGMQQAKLASDQMFKKLRIEDFTDYKETDNNTFEYEGIRYSYNGAGHIVGTHRMGSSKDDSVTNSYCKSWDHPNLYVVGAGNMTTLGTSNPTLTLAAFTIRSVESILDDLEHNLKTKKK